MKTNAVLHQQISNWLDNFVSQYLSKHGQLPLAEADPDWPSPCEQAVGASEQVYWRPIVREQALSFANVEQALDISLHDDFKTYFSGFHSENIDAVADDGELTLLFTWNEKDFERLQQNIIGHVLMKQKLKQPISLFFAVTDEEDMIISLDNASGEVWVEQVGCQPHKKLANSLAEFLASITVKL